MSSARATPRHHLEDFRARLEAFEHDIEGGDPSKDEVAQALHDLQIALEEIEVADEEMALQNEELIAVHQALDAERLRYSQRMEAVGRLAGGIAHPADADYPGMPLNAVQSVPVDHVVSLAELGPLLVRLTAEPAAEAERNASVLRTLLAGSTD